MDLRFENLSYLHLLWVIAALVAVIVYGAARQRSVLNRFAAAPLLSALLQDVCIAKRRAKSLLMLAALAALVLALIDPRWGRYYENIPHRGNDVIFVLDVSRSMLAEDLAPNRLERAKQYISDVLDVMAGDRVGLVTFAGKPVLKCPLTVNYSAFRLTLADVSTQSSPRGGTLIGDGIRLAAESFVDEVKEHKFIVVITDGEDHESYPIVAAREARNEHGIRVYTIGLGDDSEGARVPDKSGESGLYIKQDGRFVWSKMNPKTLREIAVEGEGAYIPVGTADVDMGRVLYEDRIAQAEGRELETRRVERLHVRYQWFAGLALVLLITEMLLSDFRGNGRRGARRTAA
jgi:Ca-activated chloride channel family protein